MQIHLWQQFSSNHSSAFWVYGTFEDHWQAQTAYAEILAMLKEVYNDSRLMQVYGSAGDSPEIRAHWQTFRLSNYLHTWLEIDLPPDKIMVVIGNLIFAHDHDLPDTLQTWVVREPFMGLFQAFGVAQLVAFDVLMEYSEAYKNMTTTHELHFILTDPTRATQLEQELRTYSKGDLLTPPPWQDDQANFTRAFELSDFLKPAHVQFLRTIWEDEYRIKQVGKDDPHKVKRLAMSSPPRIRRIEWEFTLQCTFHTDLGLAAFIAYLITIGCEHLKLSYKVIPVPPEP